MHDMTESYLQEDSFHESDGKGTGDNGFEGDEDDKASEVTHGSKYMGVSACGYGGTGRP